MRHASLLFFGIILGGIASGLSLGIFLHKANADRVTLSERLADVTTEINDAVKTSEVSIREANEKLAAANVEVMKAQRLIKNLAEERDLLARATVLSTPSGAAVRGWNDTVDVGLGVSVKVPPESAALTNDQQNLTVGTMRKGSSDITPWLNITVYSEQKENETLSNLMNSTPVTFVANNHLLQGVKGQTADTGEPAYLLRARRDGMIQRLIWIKSPQKNPESLTTVLSTMVFQF